MDYIYNPSFFVNYNILKKYYLININYTSINFVKLKLFYLNNPYNIQLNKDNSIEAIIALKNPYNEALGTKKNAILRTIALITKENKPNVKIVIGKEKSFIIGLIVLFKAPITMDNIIKVPIEPMYILLKKLEQIYNDNALTSKFTTNFFIFEPPYNKI